MDHKELWKKIFRDTDPYIDFYFEEKAKKSIVYSKYEAGELASMAFFTSYPVVYRGEECACPYIVGVATREESRHKGYMTLLLEQGLMDAKGDGAKLAFLSPADEKIYEPLGFQGVYYRRQLEVGMSYIMESCTKWYAVTEYPQLDTKRQQRAGEFANAQLYASDLNLYIHRSREYYGMLCKEAEALGGSVLVLEEGGYIKAVVSYIHEEDVCEVTEVICAKEDGRKVMETICDYLSGKEAENETAKEADKVIFSDGYFLGDVSGTGIHIRQMEKPYIMIKPFDEAEDISGLNVYINDIT